MSRTYHKVQRWRLYVTPRKKKVILLTELSALVLALLYAGFTFLHWQGSSFTGAGGTVALNGSGQWNDDEQVTAPSFSFSDASTRNLSVSPLFEQYYQSSEATKTLGEPLTVAFPTQHGWVQFFRSGALLLPATKQTSSTSTDTDDTFATLVSHGTKDAASGVIRLHLLQALFTLGSQIPIVGTDSSITYVDLRKASDPDSMQEIPSNPQKTPVASVQKQMIFIKGGTRAGKNVGHSISQPLWGALNNPDIAPTGWEKDFGTPLTEAIPFTVTVKGHIHHMQVQAFSYDALLLDQDTRDASGQPFIGRLSTGVDYLRTAGLPGVAIHKQQQVWTQADTTVLKTPDRGQLLSHLGQHFPLTLFGDTRWINGMLWYHIQWGVPKSTSNGWIPASAVTFTSPGNVAGEAGIDALSPKLSQYLTSMGNSVGVAVYDVTRQRTYTYNKMTQFTMASSVKVPILLTFLDMVESQGREPNDDEMNLLTNMIEHSDNDAASALFSDSINGADGINSYLQKVGITGMSIDPHAWGYSTTTPQAMVDLLTLLHNGKTLNNAHRQLALDLMQNVEADQQAGIGDTAPQGASVAMKDGWVTDENDQWVMNTSGIVTTKKETYIISVYTDDQPSLESGQAITRKVCSTMAALLP